MTVTVLVGDVAEVTDKIDAYQSRRSGPYRVKLIAALRHMFQNAGLRVSRDISIARNFS